jgi:hypothetical protein
MSKPSRKVSEPQLKILWGIGAICAFPGCGQWLVEQASASDPAAVIGEMAHIVAHSDEGPRADPSFPAEKRNLAENLILLCPTHHTLADAQDSTYTVAQLRSWKEDQERAVRDLLAAKVKDVGFEELDRVTRGLLAVPPAPLNHISLPLKPREKMALNGLTAATESLLNVGYLRYLDVEEFAARTEAIEQGFGAKLAAGFKQQYRLLIHRGVSGDALFFALADWGATSHRDLSGKAATVAVLTYLFHVCDVFES